MGYKCRGTYTIRGEGTEALVADLNKKVIVGEATGKGFDFSTSPEGMTFAGEVIVGKGDDVVVDLTPLLGPTWAGRKVVGGKRAGFDGRLTDFYVPDTVSLLVWGEEWPLTIANGEASFFAEAKWEPPVEALKVLSERYPVEITLGYSMESDNWMNGRTLRFRDGKVTQVRYGDFVLAEQGQPIHHWLVECRGAAITLLKAAGVTYRISDGKTPEPDDEVLVAVRDTDIAKVKSMTGVGECLAYTLDEDEYIYSVQTDLEWGALYPKDGKFIDIVERPIELLPQEVEDLYVKMVDLGRQAAHQRREPGSRRVVEDVTEVELSRYGRYFGRICTENQVFHPTAKEIKILMETAPADRQKELLEALGQPAWTKRWPKSWEEQGQ